MLLEFRVRNYRSFRDEQTLSLVAGPGDEHAGTHTMPVPGSEGDRAVRVAALYGANASGKTNLLLAVKAMREAVVRSAVGAQRGDAIAAAEPFRLSEATRTAPTRFEATFVVEAVEYTYGFEATRAHVRREWLHSYPRGRRRRWFERTRDSETGTDAYDFGESMRGEKQQIATATRANALFLSTAAQLNNDSIGPVFDWFRDRVTFLEGRAVATDATLRMCADDETREAVARLMQAADVGIQHLIYSDAPPPDLERALELMQNLINDDAELSEFSFLDEFRSISFLHGGEDGAVQPFDLGDESHGTQQLFALAGPLLSALAGGHVLLVDELDASLHPRMVEEVIDLFNDPEANPKGAQLVCNLHDTTPFDRATLRRDQIWLTEKFADGASELVALLEYAPRKDEALEKRYRQGRYGGVPVPRIVQRAKAMTHAEKQK
jgi:predicted ATPase